MSSVLAAYSFRICVFNYFKCQWWEKMMMGKKNFKWTLLHLLDHIFFKNLKSVILIHFKLIFNIKFWGYKKSKKKHAFVLHETKTYNINNRSIHDPACKSYNHINICLIILHTKYQRAQYPILTWHPTLQFEEGQMCLLRKYQKFRYLIL